MKQDRFISFIIVNYNGIEYLKECFDTLNKLNYPKDKQEYIMVDNGSVDESVCFVEKNYPNVKIIRNSSNEGFAKPNNDAAKIAKGEYLALINNDMRLDKNWLNDMLNTLENCNDSSYACVGSKILNWNGSKLDFAGGSITFEGEGYQFDYGMDIEKANVKYSTDRDILFACGGSMLIRRDVFLEIGGFDEDYFAYYEDVDLGWRLWLLGYKVRFCSSSKCFHKHNGTSKKFDASKKSTLLYRNRLYTIYKNYSAGNVDILNCSIFLMLNRLQRDLKIDTELFQMSKKRGYFKIDDSKDNFSILVGINEFVANIDKFNVKREFIQNNRKISDLDLGDLIPDPFKRAATSYYCDYDYASNFNKMIKNYNLEEKFGKKLERKILLISNDKVGKKMAGPGIRYFEFAKQLSKYNRVTLAVPNKINFSEEEYKEINFVEYDLGDIKGLIAAALESDIIVIQGFILNTVPQLKEICKKKVLIVDIYDPFVIEVMENYRMKNFDFRMENHGVNLKVQLEQLKLGDYFICASEKQKDLWIGMLSAVNKINPIEYDLSSNLDKLIGLVPFGIATEEPVNTKNLLQQKITNYKETDKIILWGGGIWNWFDPITLIKAVHKISQQRDDVKLFFMGVKHPNPAVPEMEACNQSLKLSEELGIKDKNVFFNMDWVDYDDRQNYLLGSHIGVSCHLDNLETNYSFRTRILDYLWAKLPIIATEGDFFAELIKEKGLGIVVKYRDVDGLADAIIKMVDDSEFYSNCKENIEVVRENYKWDVVMKPLIDFCNSPIKKKNVDPENMDELIVDVEQVEQDSVLGELVKGRKVGQKFECRYPNLCSIDLKVGTYLRKNNCVLKFKLFEATSNEFLLEEEVEAINLLDNSWTTIEFKPIANSQGRSFYFYLEGQTDDLSKCITLWKMDEQEGYGSIWENGKLLGGSLVFRTKCMYSKEPLDKDSAIVLADVDDFNAGYLNNFSISSNSMDSNNLNSVMMSSVNEIQKLRQKVSKMENSFYEVDVKYNKIESWMDKIDRKLRKISRLNILSVFRRLFRK